MKKLLLLYLLFTLTNQIFGQSEEETDSLICGAGIDEGCMSIGRLFVCSGDAYQGDKTIKDLNVTFLWDYHGKLFFKKISKGNKNYVKSYKVLSTSYEYYLYGGEKTWTYNWLISIKDCDGNITHYSLPDYRKFENNIDPNSEWEYPPSSQGNNPISVCYITENAIKDVCIIDKGVEKRLSCENCSISIECSNQIFYSNFKAKELYFDVDEGIRESYEQYNCFTK